MAFETKTDFTAPGQTKSAVTGNKTALIVDDSETNQAILAAYLQALGYSIISAYDGNQGLEKFKNLRPRMVFLDIVMPKISGINLLKEIKRHAPDTIVIMVSSYVSRQTLQQTKDAGANWFLKKPFSKEDINAIVQQFEGDF